MAKEVKVPPMGESITSGIIAAWRVKDGDSVERDQVLLELETDKITSEVPSPASGCVSLKAKEGDEVSIGQVVAEIDESADGKKSADQDSKPDKSESPSEGEKPSGKENGQAGKDAPKDAVSPAVRRLSAETGIDPAEVEGSGKGGRVTKGDMLAAAKEAEQKPASAKTEERPRSDDKPPANRDSDEASRVTRRKMTPLRQRIAQRLVSAQHEAAILSTFNECDVSAVKDLRARHQDDFVKKHGIKLGFMSFFIKAVVHALREVPQVNARIEGDTLVQNHFYDIGVAVSTEKGLMVPVVRDCDKLGLAALEKEIAGFAKKAREGKMAIQDLEGGVFSITNGGIFGSLLSTPILNPPQSGILGMHAIQERPVAVKGEVVIRPMMYLALSYDHRVVDGSQAVTFLVKVKQAIEDPSRLLLDV